jgi:hypothetical protein
VNGLSARINHVRTSSDTEGKRSYMRRGCCWEAMKVWLVSLFRSQRWMVRSQSSSNVNHLFPASEKGLQENRGGS